MVECTRCGKVFKYESERKRHELSHLPGFECNKCGKKFTYISALKRHEKQHERTGTVKCDKCDHSFKDTVLLQRHMKYAHEGTHICKVCEAQFSSDQALRVHTLTHKPKSERRYSCRYADCNKTFNFSHHLKYHEMTHTNSRQHFCNVCGKGFIQSHNLKVHMKTHEASKRLLCKMPNCTKKFNSESALKRHLARHKKVPIDPIEPPEIVINAASSEGDPRSPCDQFLLPSFSEDQEISKEIHANIDLSASQLLTNVDECQVGIEDDLNDTSESMACFNTCRSVLGKCLVTGDTSGNGNCLCDQMVKANTIKDPIEENKRLHDVVEKNNAINACDDCDCSNVKSNTDKIVGMKKVNPCMPEFEYGVNGIIKVINTIDSDLEGIVNVNMKPKVKSKCLNAETIPYNSCKAILGTCIVSGNGTISEDCLCARMLIDDQQMTSQEIEEITPQPNDSMMCL